MPIDPSIALGVKSPQFDDPAQKILTLRNMAQQQQAQQQEMQLRSQQMEQNRLQLAGEQRKQSEVAAMSAALKDSMEVDPATGLHHTNYGKAAEKLASQGFVDSAEHLREAELNSSKSRMAFREQLAKFQAAGKEHLGELAYDATRLVESGKPMGVIRSGIIGRVAVAAGDGLISEEDAHRFIGQIGAVQDPADLKGIFEQFLTPAIRERETKIAKQTADAKHVELENTGELPETPAVKSTRLTAEARQRELDRHNRVIEMHAQGAEPLVPVMKDGKPVLVRRSQAEGMTPASTRAQGKQVTAGDAEDLANFDTSLDDLKVLRKAISEAGSTGLAAQFAAATPWVTQITGWGADAKKKQALIDRVRQVIGKTLEGGVLRKEDEVKYEKILPTIGDANEVVIGKLDGLDAAIAKRKTRRVDALADAGYDTDRFRSRDAKAEAEKPKADTPSVGAIVNYKGKSYKVKSIVNGKAVLEPQ